MTSRTLASWSASSAGFCVGSPNHSRFQFARRTNAGPASRAGELISTYRPALAVRPLASVTCTVKLYEPACVGVPASMPAELTESPGGSEPPVKLQLSGDLPPLTVRAREYATPTVPLGRVLEVMEGSAYTATER